MTAISPPPVPGCPLCAEAGGTLIWHDADWRVVRVAEPDFPAFYRVISERHVVEISDLPRPAQQRCMDLVLTVEQVLRARLAPTKINLAALGNVVPHLHWHVIPRFADDPHFPNSVWSTRVRDSARALPAGFIRSLRQRLGELLGPKYQAGM